MIAYDEGKILRELNGLSPRARAAFALSTATRILPCYRRFQIKTGRGDANELEAIANRLWVVLANADPSLHRAELERLSQAARALIPDEEESWDNETQPYGEDAAAALAYATDALLSGDPQEAAWASRRSYEAIDYFVRERAPAARESAILGDPLVQAELARQLRDLQELKEWPGAAGRAELLKKLRERSRRETEEFFDANLGV